MMMNKKVILTSIFLSIALTINAQSWWGNSKKVRGNGNVTTETRKTDSYDKIAVGGSFDVVLVAGKEGNITIKGEENLLPYIETIVENNKLKVRYKKNVSIRTTKALTVTVPFTDLKGVALGGSGNITSTALIKSKDFGVSMGGSGKITLEVEATKIGTSIGGSGSINLSGKADEFKCSIAGSGSINAYDLQVDTTSASIAGSGSVKTSTKSSIKASVAGSGNIYYKGDPEVKKSSIGSGSVIKKN